MQSESILQSIKKLLGIEPDYTYFDQDLIIHINSVLSILSQIGFGPEEGFFITGETETWDDLFDESNPQMQLAKSYIYLKVRLMFDPPLNSTVINSINAQIAELEWRLNVVPSFNEE